jgi:polysaccharide export outer membrane protein
VKRPPKVADVLRKAVPRLVGEFPDRSRPKDIVFGNGDIVGVTIFEASSGGLFIPAEAGVRPGNFITIPPQAVDVNGNISIPYAGAIRARGRTQVEIQQAIVDALKDRAIEPQAIVSVVEQRTSLITVLGDVARSGRIPAQLTPERILDTISRAGGTAGPGPDEWVMLERGGRRALSPFGALVYEPANNIYIHPNDIIYVYREPQTYLTFGALGSQQQLPFGAWRITLAEAVAKAGGLRDTEADPAQYVFIAVKPATLRRRWASTPPSFRGQSSQSSTTLISATPGAISSQLHSKCAIRTSFMSLTRFRSRPLSS